MGRGPRRSRPPASCSSSTRRSRPNCGLARFTVEGTDVKPMSAHLRLQDAEGPGPGLARQVRRVPQHPGRHRPARGDRLHRADPRTEGARADRAGHHRGAVLHPRVLGALAIQRADVRAGPAAVPAGAGAGRPRDLRAAGFRRVRDLRYPVHAGRAGAGDAGEDPGDRERVGQSRRARSRITCSR